MGIEPASSGLLDQCSTTKLQKPLPTTWARVQYILYEVYIATGPGLGLIYIYIYNVYLNDTRISYTLL